MANFISEDDIEKSAIALLKQRHNYMAINCYTQDSDKLPDNSGRSNKKQVVLPEILLESLIRLNPNIPQEVLKNEWQELCKTHKTADLMGENYQNYSNENSKGFYFKLVDRTFQEFDQKHLRMLLNFAFCKICNNLIS